MAEPKSKEINDEIQKEASSVIGRGTWYWLGINDEETEGTWVYNSDGETIEWSNWQSGQGNYGSSENCAITSGSSDTTVHGKWYDVPCATSNRYFICEF